MYIVLHVAVPYTRYPAYMYLYIQTASIVAYKISGTGTGAVRIAIIGYIYNQKD